MEMRGVMDNSRRLTIAGCYFGIPGIKLSSNSAFSVYDLWIKTFKTTNTAFIKLIRDLHHCHPLFRFYI